MSSKRIFSSTNSNTIIDTGPRSSTVSKPKKYSQDELFSIDEYKPQLSKKVSVQIPDNDNYHIDITNKRKKLSQKQIINNCDKKSEELEDDYSNYSFLDSFKNYEYSREIQTSKERKKSYQEDFSFLEEKKVDNDNIENIRNYHMYTYECLKQIKNLAVPQPKQIKDIKELRNIGIRK